MMEPRTRKMFLAAAWVALAVIVTVVIYGVVESLLTTGTELAIGIVLVNVNWPLPWFAEPVSYFSIACVVFFYSGLRIWEPRIAKWSPAYLYFLQLFGFIVAYASAYEVMYNFMLWGSLISAHNLVTSITSIDVAQSPGEIPWNLNFATKAFSALFVISGYSVYFIRRVTHGNLI